LCTRAVVGAMVGVQVEGSAMAYAVAAEEGVVMVAAEKEDMVEVRVMGCQELEGAAALVQAKVAAGEVAVDTEVAMVAIAAEYMVEAMAERAAVVTTGTVEKVVQMEVTLGGAAVAPTEVGVQVVVKMVEGDLAAAVMKVGVEGAEKGVEAAEKEEAMGSLAAREEETMEVAMAEQKEADRTAEVRMAVDGAATEAMKAGQQAAQMEAVSKAQEVMVKTTVEALGAAMGALQVVGTMVV